MKSTSQGFISPLTQARESFASVAAEAAAAEAAVTRAKENYEIAKVDDGETDPAVIFDRTTAAKKELFIREAEAKRATKRLSEATTSFETSIEDLASPLLVELTRMRDGNADKLTKELAPKLPKNDLAAPTLRSFVDRCNGVVDFNTAIQSIHQGLERLPMHGPRASGLLAALEGAEHLVAKEAVGG